MEKLFGGKCWGSCEPPKILGGNFWKNVKEKNWGGEILGVVRRGACDAVGMVRKKKGKIFPKKIYWTFLGGVVYRGTCVGGTAGK